MSNWFKSKAELRDWITFEKSIYFPNGGSVLPFGLREKDILASFCKLLRKVEYYGERNRGLNKILLVIYNIKFHRLQNSYALHIQPYTCGKGLSIGHVGPIVINGKTKIGQNFRVHIDVNIGESETGVPIIGDNVYVAPGAKIYGGISISNGCVIGANAVVNKSCLEENMLLVGVPAKVTQKNKI